MPTVEQLYDLRRYTDFVESRATKYQIEVLSILRSPLLYPFLLLAKNCTAPE